MPIADPHGFIAAICAAVGTWEFAALFAGRGSHEDRWTRAAQVASLGSAAPDGSVPVEFAGSVFGVFAAFVVAEGCAVGELVAVPVAAAVAVAFDAAIAAADDPLWPIEGALQAESRSITASVTA
ncbi:MAG TPA: hypothetical protein VFX24_16660 [Ktedonobacterales bacterium]|nr:hypothetical protein [Ktedonobacterales bacterium]